MDETTHIPHPAWSYPAVIYELNVRQLTPEGTFAAAEKHLPRLRELGIDAVWLMPIHPIGETNRKGTLGSYYAVRDYCGVNPEFGTMADFDRFVSTAHGLGLKVLLDWVANHTARDARWVTERPADWYERDAAGEPTAGTTRPSSTTPTAPCGRGRSTPCASGSRSTAWTGSAAIWPCLCPRPSGRRLRRSCAE